MADFLSASYISSMVETYSADQYNQLIAPLQTRKSKYQNLSSAYMSLSSKLVSFKTLLSDFTTTGTSSLFKAKVAASSNEDFVAATVNSAASAGNYTLRVNQLAKSDMVLSQMLDADTANAITGKHTFQINTGDGSTGQYTSNVEVEFGTSETNETMMQKVRDAINQDKVTIKSLAHAGTDAYSGGPSTFTIDLNGTETSIAVNGGGTYSDLMTELAGAITTKTSGIVAEVVDNAGSLSLNLTVTDNTKYISISHDSGTDLVTDLGLGVTKEKAASGLVTASAFSPNTGMFQFSLTAKESGLDNRIKDIHDVTGTALAGLGLNAGSTREAFNQDTNTAGYLYTDITASGNLLNSKLTFNGINVQRNSNSIDDLASGVTFKLKSIMRETDASANVTSSIDVEGIRKDIEGFIDKFNNVYTFLKSNSGSSTTGVFTSNAIANSLTSLLKSVSIGAVSGFSSDSINMLAKIGIKFDSANGLSVSDGDTLEDQIENNLSGVESFFNDADKGIANVLYKSISTYTGTAGYINNAKSSADSSITTYSNKIKSAQLRIDSSADNLRKQYQALQSQLSSLYASYNSITGM